MAGATGSPYPWIADEVWRAWNPRPGRDFGSRNPIREPLPTEVSEGDRRRAGRLPAEPKNASPASHSLDFHEGLLDSTRGSGHVSQVRWPICCSRLTTLISSSGSGWALADIERRAGDLDEALLESHVEDGGGDLSTLLADWAESLAEVRGSRHAGDGINLFVCRACGRVYGAVSEP